MSIRRSTSVGKTAAMALVLWILQFLIICCVLALSGCSRTIDDIIASEPSVTGVVTEVYENSFVMLGKADGYSVPREYNVSLNAEKKDSYTSVSVGDEVVVYYGGDIAENSRPKIATVYAIILKTPAAG